MSARGSFTVVLRAAFGKGLPALIFFDQRGSAGLQHSFRAEAPMDEAPGRMTAENQPGITDRPSAR